MSTDLPPGPLPAHPVDAAEPPAGPAPVRPDYRRAAREAAVVLVVFVVAGAAGGWLWQRVWTPPTGVVRDGRFQFQSWEDVGHQFGATGWYVVIGLAGGAVLGLLAALLARTAELVTLAAVALGSALAGLVAWRLGAVLAPPDPTTLTGLGPDDVVPAQLVMPVGSWLAAWPLGALGVLFVVYVLTTGVESGAAEARRVDDRRGFSRNRRG